MSVPVQENVIQRIQENPVDQAWMGEHGSLTMERRVAREPEWVWQMLTTVRGASQWSPCVPQEDLTGTGAAVFQEDDASEALPGEVSAFEPGEALAFTWGEEELTWTLAPADGYTDITLTQQCSSEESLLACAAGWHICLATLETLGDDESAQRVVGQESMDYGWQELHESYRREFAL